jgi:hypothetical protein
MRRQAKLVGLGIALAAVAHADSVLLRPDPLNVAHLSVPDATKTQMRSGFDYNDGNYDSGNLVRVEPAGASFSNAQSAWVLFDAEGPGAITSLWFTGKSKQGQAYLGGRLNFHFDVEHEPSLSGDLPGFFESGDVFPRPLAEKSSGGWVCYAPIYFARSLKVTLTDHRDSFAHRRNGRGETIPHLYHQLTWQRLTQPVKSSRAEDLRRTPLWQRDERGVRESRDEPLPPGARTTVFTATGQGILNALRLRFDGVEPDQAGLRISADGAVGVDLAVPEFWGFTRDNRPQARFQSLLLGIDDTGAYYSFWPMPHRKSLRVEIENRAPAGRVHVESIHLPRWTESEHLPFRAERITDTAQPGRDIRLLEVQGRGHFVGCILALADQTLEGDDRFYVDGEPFPPAWHGTGTEDYFRCGWYFHGGPLTRPLYGLMDAARPKIAYRLHLADRVNFTTSLVLGFEHGHRNEFSGPYRGVVFWYGERARQ